MARDDGVAIGVNWLSLSRLFGLPLQRREVSPESDHPRLWRDRALSGFFCLLRRFFGLGRLQRTALLVARRFEMLVSDDGLQLLQSASAEVDLQIFVRTLKNATRAPFRAEPMTNDGLFFKWQVSRPLFCCGGDLTPTFGL